MVKEDYLSKALRQFEQSDPIFQRLASKYHLYTLQTPEMLSFIEEWTKNLGADAEGKFVSPEDQGILTNPDLPYTVRPRCANPRHTPDKYFSDSRGVVRCKHESVFEVDPARFLRCSYFDREASKPAVHWALLKPEDRIEYEGNLAQQVAELGSDPFEVRQCCDAIISNKDSTLSLEYILRRHNLTGNQLKVTYGERQAPVVGMVSPHTVIGKTYNGLPVLDVRDELILPYGAADLASVAERWWMQVLPGCAPVYRIEEESYGVNDGAEENSSAIA